MKNRTSHIHRTKTNSVYFVFGVQEKEGGAAEELLTEITAEGFIHFWRCAFTHPGT